MTIEAQTQMRRLDEFPIELFQESPLNPRKTFHPKKLEELTASVRVEGVLEPLITRPAGKNRDKLEIIAGARRYRAAKAAGVTHVLAVVRDYTDAQAIAAMAIENGQRDDVPPLEEAAGYKQLLLIDKTYTAAMIAEKIGRTEKFVWDRLRLLELVPEIQELLTSGEIGVEHAEVIAKLKPAEQKSLLKVHSYQRESGLFEHDSALDFEDDPTRKKPRKVVSVRQLKQYIAEHVRLDIQHAAAAAPLEFGETAKRVEEAQAQPGRGKKVIPITFSHYCPDGAKSGDERTYGSTSWKKAENKDGEPTCDHAVLGLVVAGEQYGASFKVCIARDRCRTHWRESVEAKEKAAKQRSRGKPQQADKTEAKQREKEQRAAERKRLDEEAFEKLLPLLKAETIAQIRSIKKLTAKHAAAIEDADLYYNLCHLLHEQVGKKWYETPVTAWLLVAAAGRGNYQSFDEYLKDVVQPLGLEKKPFEAIRDKHQPKPEAAAPAKKPAKGKKAAA